MSTWTYRRSDGKAASKIVPPRLRILCWKGLGADSEEKREPASDIDTVVVDSLKALDPKWPIREVDVGERLPVVIADDEAGVGLLDGPGRREAADGHRVRDIIACCRLRQRLLCVGLREYHLGSVDIRFGRCRREHSVD